MRLNQLLALLPQGTDTMATLKSLQQVAVLVQGCWVVKRFVNIHLDKVYRGNPLMYAPSTCSCIVTKYFGRLLT